MKKWDGFHTLLIVAVLVGVCTSLSYANLIYVERIRTNYVYGTTWYTYNSTTEYGQINFNNTGGSSINGFTAGGTDYTITGLTLTFISEMLDDSASSGGIARGTFEGGVDVTLSGTIGGYTGIILQGTITEATFELEELYTDAKEIDGQVHLALNDTVGVATGIDIGNGNIYKMLDPQVDMFLMAASTVENFHSGNITTGITASSIEFTAAPEPMTLMFVGLGMLFLRRRK